METEIIETERGAALGFKIGLGLPLLIIKAENGYISCSYLNPEVMDKVGDCSAIVQGASDFHDILEGKIKWASRAARKLGVMEGMRGEEALNRMM